MITLLYKNDDHFVFETNDQTLFKLQSSYESFRDSEFARRLKQYENRFVFWTRANRHPIKPHLIQLAQKLNPEYIAEDVTLLKSYKKGINCQELFESFSLEHAVTFMTYLKESIDILSNNNIAHCDLRWPNIIVDCTLLEITQKKITSLPIIIDFGQARISKDACKLNNHGFDQLKIKYEGILKENLSNIS